MERLWDYVFKKLYCDKTGLIYDQLTKYTEDGNICDLPTPEQISLQVPNPCSWGSGMEDSMIHGGIMLDTVLNRYAVTGEAEMKDCARKLLKGIKLCSEVSERKGFLARSVSPADCKSYYINSSRDQYTHIIYSLIKYTEADFCTELEKTWCKNAVKSYGDRLFEDATEQNGYQLLRADGKRGLVCKMWNVAPHEALRLPMFYLGAWVCSKEDKYLDIYRKFRDEAITQSLSKQTAGNLYILLQSQYSARLLYDYDPDVQYREKHLEVLKFNAKRAAEFYIADLESYSKAEVNALAVPWFDCNLRYEWGHIVTEGYDYPVPQEPVRHKSSAIRELGSALTILHLANEKADEKQYAHFEKAVSLIDPETHATAAPVHILSGYWSQKR